MELALFVYRLVENQDAKRSRAIHLLGGVCASEPPESPKGVGGSLQLQVGRKNFSGPLLSLHNYAYAVKGWMVHTGNAGVRPGAPLFAP